MAPTGIYKSTPVSSPSPLTDADPARRPALAIGSLITAKNGKYQSLIENLEKSRTVERQMLDRLVDGGRSLTHLG
jgi:anamorsin